MQDALEFRHSVSWKSFVGTDQCCYSTARCQRWRKANWKCEKEVQSLRHISASLVPVAKTGKPLRILCYDSFIQKIPNSL